MKKCPLNNKCYQTVNYQSIVCLTFFVQSLNCFCNATISEGKSSPTSGISKEKQPLETTTEFKTWKCSDMENPSVVIPADGKQTGTIIFLHNFRQSGQDWADKIAKFRQPFMKVICPSANNMSIDFLHKSNATSWYNFEEFLDLPHIDEGSTEIDEAANYIHHLIDKEIKNGISPERIIIGGVSQGGALALHSGLSFHKKLGGIVTISAWRPLKRIFNPEFKDIKDFCKTHVPPIQ